MTTTDKSRADALTDLSDDELALIREEAARITDDWCERQFMEPSQKESDAKFVREVLRLAASPSSQPAAAPADLQGLRRSILTSREIVRDQDGMLSHPAVPYLDEDVNYETFFAAFGIEATFIHMEDDVDCDTYDRYFASNSPDCCTWTPSSPQGDGWMLLEIYDTEDGPVALYVREKKPESMRERWKREKRESDAAAPSPADERMEFVERVMGMFEAWPNGKPGPTDEPESHYRFGYNTALEDVLTALDVGSPTRRAASANETGAEGAAIELLRKFMEYRDSDYVPNVLFDCARTIIDNAMAAAAPAEEHSTIECQAHSGPDCTECGGTGVWSGKADERAASWHCEDPVQKCRAQCDSCAKQARAALKAIVDERAECIAWANANGFTKYHESMCAAWEERARRAAQQLSAEIRELKVKLGSYEREREDQIRYLAAQSEEIAGLKQQLAHADARVGLTATVIQKCIDSCAAEYLEDVTGHPEDAAYCQGITDCIDALNRLKTADWSAILATHSGQSEPETATVARIEQLRKALFESRDAMRVMSNWVKKSDPAGHSWAVRMVDRANAALNGEPEPRAEVTEEQPSLTNPLTPYGMLVRALRIVSGTTLMGMAQHLGRGPAELSAIEFGRKPVRDADIVDAAHFFACVGIQSTTHALTIAARAGGA
ncbi:hypothetical protein [Burkholderia pseudomallei]|uniref:hypothetical protein n=1 Tax=Burkholderia pseudomallei TaxID=28450 RepID=UPI000E5AA472|nr:hypothetical protein [Burkholderia pseudomallei]QGS82546.1 hypothetical protein PMC2000_29440 [Burkholderia pseudomallei]VUD64366.1 unnamed protein product [Burkholderia pseudomallei]